MTKEFPRKIGSLLLASASVDEPNLDVLIKATNGLNKSNPALATTVASAVKLALAKVASAVPDEKTEDWIHVDRTIRPVYPDWMKEVIYLHLEASGPEWFDVSTLEQWLHPNQISGTIIGNVIHEHMKENNMLYGCIGLRDLEEIQKKGITFFRKHFQGKAVFALKSVVRLSLGSLYCPGLVEVDGGVVLRWGWWGDDFRSSDPMLRFAT